MLEAATHKCLKEFLRKYPSDWNHIYSFGRIISKFLRKRENLLINSEIFLTEKWYSALLVALFLNKEDSKLILAADKIQLIIKKYLPLLKNSGFKFSVKNNEIILSNHRIFLQTIDDLIDKYYDFNFADENILFSDIDNIRQELNYKLTITLHKKDWLFHSDQCTKDNNELSKSYNILKEIFFSNAVPQQKYISLDLNQNIFLQDVIFKYANYSDNLAQSKKAILSGWASWVILDHDNFEWSIKFQPIDGLFEINKILLSNNIIFLSSFRKDYFFQKYLKRHNIKINSALNFKSNFIEKKILIYAPSHLMLPTNPLFTKSTIGKCIKLSSLTKGSSVFLSNDNNLKLQLATDLAAIHGKKVLLENHPQMDNQIVCSSYDWWINNFHLISPPHQIIIPLLPLPNIGEPINKLTVASIKNKSMNWFKEFMFPESFQKIDRAITPLRKNGGKLIILDGRINNRNWGRKILEMIQPQKEIHYIFPFD